MTAKSKKNYGGLAISRISGIILGSLILAVAMNMF